MQNIFTNIKCSEIILYNANENWHIILYDLFSRLYYIVTLSVVQTFLLQSANLRLTKLMTMV